MAELTTIRVVVRNTSDIGGTYTTPFWAGLHDNSFDLFDAGSAASAGLEALAEDGNFAPVSSELMAADSDGQELVIAGAGGPIMPLEMASAMLDVDGMSNGYISLGGMVLPSNDAFVGTDAAIKLFDAAGNFLGAQSITFAGSDVYDAGTEVNTELDAAALNQAAGNTGVDENGVVRSHDGFNGSIGNPTGEGDQNILGGTNAFGTDIDATVADFTRPGALIAEVHINEAKITKGSAGHDFFIGGSEDDLVSTGRGRDILLGGDGWDELRAGRGADLVFGEAGDDMLSGGAGRDRLFGDAGNDVLFGGAGNDQLTGGAGGDHFVFIGGKGRDVVQDFNAAEGDRVVLDVTGIDTFADVMGAAKDTGRGVVLDFGSDGKLVLLDEDIAGLDAGDFIFL